MSVILISPVTERLLHSNVTASRSSSSPLPLLFFFLASFSFLAFSLYEKISGTPKVDTMNPSSTRERETQCK